MPVTCQSPETRKPSEHHGVADISRVRAEPKTHRVSPDVPYTPDGCGSLPALRDGASRLSHQGACRIAERTKKVIRWLMPTQQCQKPNSASEWKGIYR